MPKAGAQCSVGLCRCADKTVLLVHHTGKTRGKNGRGDQRGTSKREDILNASILLFKRLDEWGRFTVEFTKSRGFRPPDEFVVLIEHDKDAGVCRLVREPQDLAERVAELLGKNMLQKDIAIMLNTNPTKINRIVQELRKQQQAEQRSVRICPNTRVRSVYRGELVTLLLTPVSLSFNAGIPIRRECRCRAGPPIPYVWRKAAQSERHGVFWLSHCSQGRPHETSAGKGDLYCSRCRACEATCSNRTRAERSRKIWFRGNLAG